MYLLACTRPIKTQLWIHLRIRIQRNVILQLQWQETWHQSLRWQWSFQCQWEVLSDFICRNPVDDRHSRMHSLNKWFHQTHHCHCRTMHLVQPKSNISSSVSAPRQVKLYTGTSLVLLNKTRRNTDTSEAEQSSWVKSSLGPHTWMQGFCSYYK